MVFTAYVAADFNGKCNFEFSFGSRPAVEAFIDRLDLVLGTEAAARRLPAQPVTPFKILRVQVFDERIEMWVDLVSAGQLHDRCQCYCFQEKSGWHSDAPGPIPPPTQPVHQAAREGTEAPELHSMSPVRRKPDRTEPADPSPQQRSRSAFGLLSVHGGGRVSASEWTSAFGRLGLGGGGGAFSDETVHDLFTQADQNGDGYVCSADWDQFAERHPQLADAVHYRNRAAERERLRDDNVVAAEQMLSDLEARCSAAEGSVRAAEAELRSRDEAGEVLKQAVTEAMRAEAVAREAQSTADLAADKAVASLRSAAAQRDASIAQAAARSNGCHAAGRRLEAAASELRSEREGLRQCGEELARLREPPVKKEEEEAAARGRVAAAEGQVDSAQRTLRSAERDAELAATGADRAREAAVSAEEELRRRHVAADAERRRVSEAQRGVAEAEAAREDAVRSAREAAARCEELRADSARSAASCDDQRQVLGALRAKSDAFRKKRSDDEAAENRLLVAECVLNEQHAAVEKRRLALKQARFDFAHDAGRATGVSATA
eukprot:TRINITY_DN20358_c0_g1_i1.p1 TRINITY_DN20358_c0_g1~~TRINITY_DN20358_c0_g1_i1.p1  ORF type:complete len:569 (+),score=230.71 TRINITY_DN20358_c0_g1_i1:58-1707(+)